MKIFPKAFGYNERALLDLADHAYSCRFLTLALALTLALTMRTPAGSQADAFLGNLWSDVGWLFG